MRNEEKNMALLEAKNVKKIYTTRFGGTQVQAIDRKEEEAMADRMYYLVFRDEEKCACWTEDFCLSASFSDCSFRYAWC